MGQARGIDDRSASRTSHARTELKLDRDVAIIDIVDAEQAIGTETRVGFVDASLASGAALADKFGVVQKELPAVYVLYFFGSCSRAAAKDSPTPMVRTQLPPLE